MGESSSTIRDLRACLDLLERELEEANDARREFYRTLIEAVPLLIWIADPAGCIGFENQRWRDLMGITEGDPVNRLWLETIYPEDRELVETRWKVAIESQQRFQAVYRIRTPDDPGGRLVEAVHTPIRSRKGRILNWLGILAEKVGGSGPPVELPTMTGSPQIDATIIPPAQDPPIVPGSMKRRRSPGVLRSQLRVLVVDDARLHNELCAEYVLDAGHEPIQAEDGEQALQILRSEVVDFVLMDLNMPGLGGLATLRELRTFDVDMPVLVMTGADEQSEGTEQFKGLNVLGILRKPFKESWLKAYLNRMLATD